MNAASVPVQLRQQVDRWAETWLHAKFSRLLELRAQDPGPFNYPIAVSSEWRGNGLTAAKCFREIEENELFWPTT
jgi:hypothetical protein